MKKEFEVVTSSTASGIRYNVYIRVDGTCTDSRLFHSKQKGKSIIGTARERCEKFCESLKGEGYEQVVSGAAKDFREAMALSREMGRTPEEHQATIESVVASMPIKTGSTPQDRYAAKNLRQFMVKINRATEPELLAHLESVDNVQGYIKSLIRADMERQAGE